MGFPITVPLLIALFAQIVNSQLSLPQYQQSGGYSSIQSGYNYNNPGGYNSPQGGYSGFRSVNTDQHSYTPASSSKGYNAPSLYGGYGVSGSFDNYKAPPRSILNSQSNNAYGLEAQGSNVKLNVGFSSAPSSGGWQRPVPKGREAWKGSKGDSDFKFFTAIGSGIDHVKNGVKKVVKGVKSTKAKIVAKGISGVGTAVSAVTKGVAGVITKVADW